eukprot:CAMPEP_0117805812 /NCGR_PEP_ID=MMETSP0948-20121206/18122_1 /TAXON_ID=44440 /ORGANISM="Chattonella subsalsa, Strain CCMP2191" /LENGTH=217 /DNA_ID=CAMNT_0005640021 /DNA_START=121 /DNA_END=771 /DNA_ORIENTATION=-
MRSGISATGVLMGGRQLRTKAAGTCVPLALAWATSASLGVISPLLLPTITLDNIPCVVLSVVEPTIALLRRRVWIICILWLLLVSITLLMMISKRVSLWVVGLGRLLFFVGEIAVIAAVTSPLLKESTRGASILSPSGHADQIIPVRAHTLPMGLHRPPPSFVKTPFPSACHPQVLPHEPVGWVASGTTKIRYAHSTPVQTWWSPGQKIHSLKLGSG